MADKARIGILLSGGGTTAEQIMLACQSGRINAEVVCVIASRGDAGGLAKAEKAGIPASARLVIRRKDCSSNDEFEHKLAKNLESHRVDFIGQHGWMVQTPEGIVERYRNRSLNQHPGPLDPGYPDFGGHGMHGKRVHCARLIFARMIETQNHNWTEAVAQRVELAYDRGEVIKRRRMEILPHENVDEVAARLLPIEHKVQIEAWQDMVNGNAQEIVRAERLIPLEHVRFSDEAKRIGKLLYPKG